MLKFWNAYGKTVNVAIMYHRPNCPVGGDWIKEGVVGAPARPVHGSLRR